MIRESDPAGSSLNPTKSAAFAAFAVVSKAFGILGGSLLISFGVGGLARSVGGFGFDAAFLAEEPGAGVLQGTGATHHTDGVFGDGLQLCAVQAGQDIENSGSFH